jgi:hypothetical protein
VKIRELSVILSSFPFDLSKDEALSLSRYLIEEDRGQGNYVELDELQEVGYVAHSLLERIGVYPSRNLLQEVKLLKRLSWLWQKNAKTITNWPSMFFI